ncbi:hypothetical protein M011DRAFT_457255 [Sporormia fimetaria CBS 119925]|uniref:C2H2-type domain-containing protein n=1 Tax=Sporormia fimetaria CBS 119925 TaxID=1340428 RepID=A0A6A6VF07_9PLEO|nr:hypothetical protein M011DRAFT_457255 [Sporormia fimetaria CBS 119925]
MVGPAAVFECGMCEKKCSTKYSLSQHMLNHKPVEMHECYACKGHFPDRKSLKEHRGRCKEAPSPTFDCTICQLWFVTSFELQKHMNAPEFQCRFCDLHFATKLDRERHRQYPSQCSDALRPRQGNKKNRKDIGHDGNGRQGHPFRHRAKRTYHSTASTEYPFHIDGDGKFCCDVCHKSFQAKAGYENHLLGCAAPRPEEEASMDQHRHDGNSGPVGDIAPSTFSTPDHGVNPSIEEQHSQIDHLTQTVQQWALNSATTGAQPAQQHIHPNGGLSQRPPPPDTKEPNTQTGDSAAVRSEETASPDNAKSFAVKADKDQGRSTEPFNNGDFPGKATNAKQSGSLHGPIDAKASHPLPGSPGTSKAQRVHPAMQPGHSIPETGHTSSSTQTHPPVPARQGPPAAQQPAAAQLHNCNVCGATFRSEPGLRQHQIDSHGSRIKTGAPARDVQKIRDLLQQQGLKYLSALPPARNGPRPKAPLRAPRQGNIPSGPAAMARPAPQQPISTMNTVASSLGTSSGGPAEEMQANWFKDKVMRLLLQADVVIDQQGKITYSGIEWTRISMTKQEELMSMFDKLCHLPKRLQASEYVPRAAAFAGDVDYSPEEFETSPAAPFSASTLDIVALAAVKVVLADGCPEVVKLAAVEVATGRILFNNFVCIDPSSTVGDWRTSETGLRSIGDFEAVRQDGYKVFKDWKAARKALWKFVTQNTIIVGHNLRSDLDALRMIHGRAVDIAKLVEKAAQGPLSKGQLRLETLCRGLLQPPVQLAVDPLFGRDPLQNAFAIRELALSCIKFEKEFAKWAKNKSLEYQASIPQATK